MDTRQHTPPSEPAHAPPQRGPSDHVPAEFLGLARTFRARVTAAAEIVGPQMNAIAAEAFAKLQRRKAGTGLRTETLVDLETRWRRMPATWRLALTIARDRHTLSIVDTRLRPERVHNAQWAADDTELSVLIVTSSLTITGYRAEKKSIALASLSLHALARFMQRSFNTSDEALFADLQMIAAAAPRVAEKPGDFSLSGVNGADWHGIVAPFKDTHGVERQTVNIRSFY